MAWGRTPSREAVSRSMTSEACSPRFCWSVATSRSGVSSRSLASMRGAKRFRSARSVPCSVYWYWALLVPAADAQVLHGLQEQRGAGHLRELAAEPVDHLVGGGLALAEGLERDEHAARVRRVAACPR